MAQLVKLQDYVSRYEQDLSRYPSQFIRLKKYQWDRMKNQWENGLDFNPSPQIEVEQPEEEGKFSSLFRFFRFRETVWDVEEKKVETVESELDFNPHLLYSPKSLDQLKKHYLDQLFHFQLKWASSTLTDKSRIDSRFMRDSLLRSFAQQLPDNFFLFYKPILLLNKAPIELEIIIMTPTECMCISVVEDEEHAAFIGSGDRFWVKKIGDAETKLLNPIIGLDRMEKIISQIFQEQSIDFPIRKLLISRNGYIDLPDTVFNLEVIDRRGYDAWFSTLRNAPIPMKFAQFKATQTILNYVQTTAMSQLFDFDDKEATMNE